MQAKEEIEYTVYESGQFVGSITSTIPLHQWEVFSTREENSGLAWDAKYKITLITHILPRIHAINVVRQFNV